MFELERNFLHLVVPALGRIIPQNFGPGLVARPAEWCASFDEIAEMR